MSSCNLGLLPSFLASGFGCCLENLLIMPSFFICWKRSSGEGRGWGYVERIEVLMGSLPSSLFERIATRCPSSCWPLEFLS